MKQSRNHYVGAKGGDEYSSYSFLTSVLDGLSGQSHAFAALCPGKRTPGTHKSGGWSGLRGDRYTEARGKKSLLCRGSDTVVQSVVSHYAGG
jgi:hypothetical protein